MIGRLLKLFEFEFEFGVGTSNFEVEADVTGEELTVGRRVAWDENEVGIGWAERCASLLFEPIDTVLAIEVDGYSAAGVFFEFNRPKPTRAVRPCLETLFSSSNI